MDALKAITDQAKTGDAAQQAIVGGFFQAISRVLSDGVITRHPEGGGLRLACPLRIVGPGAVVIRGVVNIGVFRSPNLLAGVHLGAMLPTSRIFLDDGVFLNNGSTLLSEGSEIRIGKRVLIGTNFWCLDSNFHDLAVERRAARDPDPQPVVIEDDVFIGVNVMIMKGVTIGAGSIIAAGSVVFPGFNCRQTRRCAATPRRSSSGRKPSSPQTETMAPGAGAR